MSKTDNLFHIGHRERLKEKFLSNQLTDTEKLELLLTYAIPRCDVRILSRQLMEHFGSVYSVLHAPFEELVAISGVGRSTAILIKLFHDMCLISYTYQAKSDTYLSDDKFLHEFCRSLVITSRVEEMHVLFLGGNMRLIKDEVHSRGTLDETGVYIREICARALALNAISVILVHNHPASDNDFSSDDASVTQLLKYALQSIGVALLDHILVTANGVIYSFAESFWARESSFKK